MDKALKIETYQKVLASYFTQLANQANHEIQNQNVEHQAIIDTINNHFQLIVIGWEDDLFIHEVLIHLHIHPETGNIWIYQNNTEIELDEVLGKIAEIPKKHFVLGFSPDYVREHSDYAVA